MDAHSFRVSVIIPVYNAERFLEEAVLSALAQPETGEVLLIEDHSPDNSLAVCLRLAEQHEKVRLLQHPDKGNHGAGASRNLGIRSARFRYICFLDSDDYMLPDRFKPAMKVFKEIADADGVYDAVGTYFMNEEAKEKWFQKRSETLTTINKRIPPEEVFYCQTLGRYGVFCTDGIVLRKEVFDKAGLFDTDLKLAQDTHLWIRIAAHCKLYPGSIEAPVANRRLHANNRYIGGTDLAYYKVLMWNKLFAWSSTADIPQDYKAVILSSFILANRQNRKSLPTILLRYPQLLLNKLFYSYLFSKFRGIFASRDKE